MVVFAYIRTSPTLRWWREVFVVLWLTLMAWRLARGLHGVQE